MAVENAATASGIVGALIAAGADVQGRYGVKALDTAVVYNLAGAVTSTATTVSIAG